MYLDKVEIHGFKSFGDSIKLTIPKGITAVIGPNGSGKSNVADAIRWVIGEQSAKTLRGSKMEDVIFSGTEKRKSLGYAEVCMYIKDPNNELPIEYTELAIKRRFYRSGESEYFINGSLCRLKDIQELFMDTGIGKEGYSIIGQGQIDKILSYKPDDRRGLFEEATGIYKYKSRRQEAQKNLEKQRENLVRVQDIIDELALRIGPLEIEAQKAKEYNVLIGNLKELDINIYLEEVKKIQNDEITVKSNLEAIDEQLRALYARKTDTEKNYEEWKKNKDKIYREIEEVSSIALEIEKEKQNIYTEIEVTKEKIANSTQLLVKAKDEKVYLEKSKESLKQELALLETKYTALQIEEVSKKNNIENLEGKLDNLNKEIECVEKELNTSKIDKYNKLRDIDLLKAEIEKIDTLQEELDYRYNQVVENINILNSNIQHQEIIIESLEKSNKEISQKSTSLEESLSHIEHEKIKVVKEKSLKEQDLEKNQRQLIETERKLNWLKQIKEDHEGYYTGVRQVLKIVKEDPNKWNGIKGVVGELLEVDKKYEIAIITALGGAIQNIVTDTEQDAKNMITVMKQKGIAKVTFLPKETIQAPNALKDHENLAKEMGYLGIASDLVHYDAHYKNIFLSLLGKIIVIDNMENASKVAKKYNYKYKIVTLEGEIFNIGGSLTGGSTKNNINNVFTRSREIQELDAKQKEYKTLISALQEEISNIESNLNKINQQWDKISGEIDQIDKIKSNTILECDKATNKLRLLKDTQLTLIKEQNELGEKISNLQNSRELKEEKLLEIMDTTEEHDDTISETEGKILELKRQKDEYSSLLTEKKVDISSTMQSIGYTLEKIKEAKEKLASYDSKKIEIEENIKEIDNNSKLLNEKIISFNAEVDKLEDRIRENRAKRESYNTIKDNMQKEEEALTSQSKEIIEKLDIVKQEKYRLENKLESYNMQKENYDKDILEKYELTYEKALYYKKDMGTLSKMNEKAKEIKLKIKEVGNVYVDAIEEFEEVSARYNFLMSQKLDIEKAEKALLSMIDDLMLKMEKIFKEQFAKIASNFSKVFTELFGGGEAYLKLTDEDNILESGIEIFAKPPGKKVQTLTLLSGGERTLTAIALLFAILKLKPSPFCVLDEIESALDDANVIRFANYLQSLSDETQFIVITHRKGTMERAHTLYGVTMQERGVSTVVSVQLQDASKYLDNNESNRRKKGEYI